MFGTGKLESWVATWFGGGFGQLADVSECPARLHPASPPTYSESQVISVELLLLIRSPHTSTPSVCAAIVYQLPYQRLTVEGNCTHR